MEERRIRSDLVFITSSFKAGDIVQLATTMPCHMTVHARALFWFTDYTTTFQRFLQTKNRLFTTLGRASGQPFSVKSGNLLAGLKTSASPRGHPRLTEVSCPRL